MLYSHHLRSPSNRSQIDQGSFSFVDGFADEKETKTTANSTSKRSDIDTTSCCTHALSSDCCQRDQLQAFYSQSQTSPDNNKANTSTASYGLTISKQINYSTPQQYQQSLQNLLNDININSQNKIYLRLIILDHLYQKDDRFQQYFQAALEQYRLLKQNYFTLDSRIS